MQVPRPFRAFSLGCNLAPDIPILSRHEAYYDTHEIFDYDTNSNAQDVIAMLLVTLPAFRYDISSYFDDLGSYDSKDVSTMATSQALVDLLNLLCLPILAWAQCSSQ